MPVEYKFYPDSTLKSINSCQNAIKKKQFDEISEEGKMKLYVNMFAFRNACGAERGKKSSLKVPVNADKLQASQAALQQSQTFMNFVKDQGHAKMKQMLTEGHGGKAEESFQNYIMGLDKLPTDVPTRYLPKAKDRIEQQQNRLTGLDPRSKEAAAVYAEIFRTRLAVGAVRKKASSLEPRITADAYAKAPDLSASPFFQQFVQSKGPELKAALAVGEGHGGAGEDLFTDYVLNAARIPADLPMNYSPEAKERCEALQKQMQGATNFEKRNVIYNELMATRDSVGAVRGKKSSLEIRVDPAALQKSYAKWESCATFQSYLQEHDAEAREALLKGHGGALSDKFEEHVKNLDHIPADVPEESMPEAKERLEAIQEKFKEVGYFESPFERKLTLAAEIMATREAVGAVRNKPSSLEKKIDPKKLQESCKRWSECKAFRDFVQNEGAKVYDGTVAGHGGALGDKFKEYLLSRDELEADIPSEFMPTAQARTEALQKKIRENGIRPADNDKLYAELIASRAAVGAVRGKKGSLEPTIDPKRLEAERKQLLESAAFQQFIKDPAKAPEIQRAALEGHGGALEDAFKDYVRSMKVIPENTPARYMPNGLERAEALQQKIADNNFADEADRAAVYVELMATRQAVGAVRGKKDSLKKPIDATTLQSARDSWGNCASFRDYIAYLSEEAQRAATAGHGGELMDKFKEYACALDELPTDLPDEVIPTANERIEALQKELKEGYLDEEDKVNNFAQILAARRNVGAERSKLDSLKKKLDPNKLKEDADKLKNSKAFKDFVTGAGDSLEQSLRSGHGGDMEDRFKHYVTTMRHLPTDIPRDYMPTAKERIEGLQRQFERQDFKNLDPELQAGYYAELMAARRSVNAERKKEDTLAPRVDPEKNAEISQKLMNCKTFLDFIKKDPGAARKAASSGHGGALEDDFKKYVLHLPQIPEDVPKDYMPTAKERTEVLQDKIKSAQFAVSAPSARDNIYRELIATRSAVNSVRGDKETLNRQIDPEKLHKDRELLKSSDGYKKFMEQEAAQTLRDAATNGHGGALEDKLKQSVINQSVSDGVMPKGLPDRFKPSAAELREQLRARMELEHRSHQTGAFDMAKQAFMKQVAASMYLFKLEKEAQQKGEAVPTLDAELMEKNVNKLVSSRAFQKMFEQDGATRRIVGQVASKRMSDVFGAFSQNQGVFELEGRQQPVLQNQRQNQRQNQQENNNNQALQNDQQRPVQNEEEQPQLRRANTMRPRQPQLGMV